MPLTPEDVSNKRFTPVRLREGYDQAEVDAFLDEVETEIARLLAENADLRARAAAVQTAAEVPPGAEAGERVDTDVEAGRPAGLPPGQDGYSAAARLLEIATRNADELVQEARGTAERLLGEAQGQAERLQAEAKDLADRLEADARSRAQLLDNETAERREMLLGDLEQAQQRLQEQVEGLRSFEREYRSRLRNYFVEQLEALDDVVPPQPQTEEV